MADKRERVSMEENEAEDAVTLPNKKVMSLHDVNANVDLGLDLAAPVDLAAAANLNVAAPIEASASADVLSPDAQAVSLVHRSGSIDQGMSGASADATAPQHASIDQNSGTGGAMTGGAVQGSMSGATGAVGGATGGVDSLLNGGSLLDANVNIHANANLDRAGRRGGRGQRERRGADRRDGLGERRVRPRGGGGARAAKVNISQHLDGVEANATAQQDASVSQK